MKDLNETEVILKLSDPWKLGEFIEWENLDAEVLRLGIRPESTFGKEAEAIILRLKNPFSFDGLDYEYLQGTPRHAGDSFSSIESDNLSIFCSFVRVSLEQVQSDIPFDLSWWRGGGGLIATITDVPHRPKK